VKLTAPTQKKHTHTHAHIDRAGRGERMGTHVLRPRQSRRAGEEKWVAGRRERAREQERVGKTNEPSKTSRTAATRRKARLNLNSNSGTLRSTVGLECSSDVGVGQTKIGIAGEEEWSSAPPPPPPRCPHKRPPVSNTHTHAHNEPNCLHTHTTQCLCVRRN